VGFLIIALAIDTLFFPPESVILFLLKRSRIVCWILWYYHVPRRFAARSTSSSVASSFKFYVVLYRIWKEKSICGTIPTVFKSLRFKWLISWLSMWFFRQLHHKTWNQGKNGWFSRPVFPRMLIRLSLQWDAFKCLYICVFISVAYIFEWNRAVYDWFIWVLFLFGSILEFIQTFWEASASWTIDETHPNEATGQVSILTYKINSAIVPIL
jgi:hypothetical protein